MVEQYELIITFTSLLLLFIIFLIICLSNNKNSNNSFEETEKITIEDRCFDKLKENKKLKKNIPKRIIQTYFCRNVPERMYNASLTFKELNPEYEYIFYDDDRAREFLRENFDKNVLEAFDLLIPGAYKADLFRICELYINGGYYADIFMENVKSLSYFDKYDVDCILVKDYNTKSNIYNAFIACKPKDSLIYYLIEKTVKNVLSRNKGNDPLEVTGPIFIGRNLLNYLKVNLINPGIIKYENDKKLLIIEHNYNGPFDKNYVCDKENNIIQTKYENYDKDRPNMTHYADLYKEGKVFKK